MVIIIILAIILFVYWLIKYIVEPCDTVIGITGGNGSGKSFFTTRKAKFLLKRQRLMVKWHNFKERLKFWKKDKDIYPKPILYTCNIVVRISKNEYSSPLKLSHLLMQEKLIPRSVVFIDEINLLVSQMKFNLGSEDALNEFCTLFRHYTLGGKLLFTTQSYSKIHYLFRYCSSEVINYSEFRKPIFGLPIIAWAKVRKYTISDDIKNIDDLSTNNDGKKNKFAFFPLYKEYDSYCFSELVNPLPYGDLYEYSSLKLFEVVSIDPKLKVKSKTGIKIGKTG